MLASAPRQSWQRAKLKVDTVAAISTAPQLKRPPTVAKQTQTIAKGSRVSSGLSGSYLYFLILERPWWFCLTLSLVAYVVSILASALLAATAVLSNTQEDLELELLNSSAPQWELCLRFAASHVITMGSGSVVPVNSWGYALSWIQMVLGLLVNVFVFSVVLAKFQAPQSDLVWTEGCVIAPRDGVPTLLMRVGNLRCHTLLPGHPTHAASPPRYPRGRELLPALRARGRPAGDDVRRSYGSACHQRGLAAQGIVR